MFVVKKVLLKYVHKLPYAGTVPNSQNDSAKLTIQKIKLGEQRKEIEGMNILGTSFFVMQFLSLSSRKSP